MALLPLVLWLLGFAPSLRAQVDPDPAPVIDVQPQPQLVAPGEPLELSVAASGADLLYQWRHEDIVLVDATNRVLLIPAASREHAGRYDVVVSNAGGSVTSDAAQVIVDAPPVLAAIPEQSTDEDVPLRGVNLGIEDAETPAESLLVRAESSDTNLVTAAGLVFEETEGARTLAVLPATNRFGTTTITVTVRDGAGREASQSFALTVRPVNDPPQFDALPPHIAQPLQPYRWTIQVSDPDPDDALTISAPRLPGWLSLDAATGLLTGVPPVPGGPEGDAVELEVSDGQGASRRVECRIWTADAILLASQADVVAKRERLIESIWGEEGWPTAAQPHYIARNIDWDHGFYDSVRNDEGNLGTIDFYVYFMPHGIHSYIWHFHPRRPNGRLFIYHAGHSWGGFMDDELQNSRGVAPGLVVPALLREGYSVLTFAMPLYNGNSLPSVDLPDGTSVTLRNHNDLFRHVERPFRFFFEPLAVTLNYLQHQYGYSRIFMTGLSGGGWTTTLYAALDPRIDRSFPVAGSVPNYLRVGFEGLGDAEQDDPTLYRIANYKELYVMAGAGFDRGHVQLLNLKDPCCFYGTRYTNWVDEVRQAAVTLPDGHYDFFLDEATEEHRVSELSLDYILRSLPPFIDPIPDQALEPGSPEQTVPIGGIRPASPTRTDLLTLSATTDNPSLLTGLSVDYLPGAESATLRFTPAPGQDGIAFVTVTVSDVISPNAVARHRFSIRILPPNVPPAISWVAPTNSAELEPGLPVQLVAEASDSDGRIREVTFFRDGTAVGSAEGAPFQVTLEGLESGDHLLTAVATDDRGGQATSSPLSVRVLQPNAPPTVQLWSPAGNAELEPGLPVQLAAEASDSDGRIREVTFFRDGTAVGSAEGAPFQVTVEGLESGDHLFTAVATDDRGGQAASSPLSLRVLQPNVPPTVQLLSPAGPVELTEGSPLDIEAVAADPDGGLLHVELLAVTLATAPEPVLVTNRLALLTEPPFRFAWTNPPVGTYLLSARVTDRRGAAIESDHVTVTVLPPNLPPSLGWVAPTNDLRGIVGEPLELRLAGADPDGQVVQVELFVDGARVALAPEASPQFLWTPATVGTHQLAAMATDNRGGTAAAPVRSVLVVDPLSIPARILRVDPLPDGALAVQVTGPSGWNAVLEGSPDLIRWEPIGTNQLASREATFLAPNTAAGTPRFFRVHLE